MHNNAQDTGACPVGGGGGARGPAPLAPLEIEKPKKSFQIFAPPPLRIPGHATGTSCEVVSGKLLTAIFRENERCFIVIVIFLNSRVFTTYVPKFELI